MSIIRKIRFFHTFCHRGYLEISFLPFGGAKGAQKAAECRKRRTEEGARQDAKFINTSAQRIQKVSQCEKCGRRTERRRASKTGTVRLQTRAIARFGSASERPRCFSPCEWFWVPSGSERYKTKNSLRFADGCVSRPRPQHGSPHPGGAATASSGSRSPAAAPSRPGRRNRVRRTAPRAERRTPDARPCGPASTKVPSNRG